MSHFLLLGLKYTSYNHEDDLDVYVKVILRETNVFTTNITMALVKYYGMI